MHEKVKRLSFFEDTSQEYFPMIRSKEEVYREIQTKQYLRETYESWNTEQQNYFGYAFPGQRAACYSSDLLLRQYKRVRGEKGAKFVYRDIKRVYSIIFFETSPSCFHAYPEVKVHHSKQRTDSGMEIELLQEYYLIPIDILRGNRQNVDIKNELDAWLLFLGDEDPEIILRLSNEYPQFRAMYEQVYSLCRNTEGLLEMFSEDKDAQLQDKDARIVELEAQLQRL